MIEYRKANINDLDVLIKLRIMFLREAGHIEREEDQKALFENNNLFFRNGLSDGSFVAFVALHDGEIIATSGLSLLVLPPNKKCPNGKAAYIGNMYTRERYRKRGIASALFSMTVQEAKRLGHTKILLNASDMGRPLYEKFGFRTDPNDMVYYAE